MKDEQTSPEVARDAGRILRDKTASPEMRRVAASALNQAPNKKRYIAVRGINFEGLKDKPRIEPGQRIPEAVPSEDIQALLSIDAIREAK
jgi:hypothetical protein